MHIIQSNLIERVGTGCSGRAWFRASYPTTEILHRPGQIFDYRPSRTTATTVSLYPLPTPDIGILDRQPFTLCEALITLLSGQNSGAPHSAHILQTLESTIAPKYTQLGLRWKLLGTYCTCQVVPKPAQCAETKKRSYT
ncbi:hypothetical protein TgHK011_005694 [Trichoderma gracile]|nr:hypothetical protein TgHK011_005694 [Trichoderma gracile]